MCFDFVCLQFFLATTTECDLCNKNGKCVLDGDNTNGPSNVRCECQPWFAGRNCQINLQLLLIVGCVSVILMIVIACCVSCLCCRDRHNPKNSIPCKFIFYLMFIFKLVRPGFIRLDCYLLQGYIQLWQCNFESVCPDKIVFHELVQSIFPRVDRNEARRVVQLSSLNLLIAKQN